MLNDELRLTRWETKWLISIAEVRLFKLKKKCNQIFGHVLIIPNNHDRYIRYECHSVDMIISESVITKFYTYCVYIGRKIKL